MNRNRVHYQPGWDCHGLPIEMKAKSIKEGMSATDIRNHGKFLLESQQKQLIDCTLLQLENSLRKQWQSKRVSSSRGV